MLRVRQAIWSMWPTLVPATPKRTQVLLLSALDARIHFRRVLERQHLFVVTLMCHGLRQPLDWWRMIVLQSSETAGPDGLA